MASIFDALLNGTLGDVHAWALPNIKGEGRERWIGSRKLDKLQGFAAKRDEPGYGVFFCVGTIATGQPRKKEHFRELVYLFADVDFKDHDTDPAEIEYVLRSLPLPPTRMHFTGNGIHCFWLLDEPFLSDEVGLAEEYLRRIAAVLGGDPSVCHVVALLRVPGTHNSKRGEWVEVQTLKEGTEEYSADDIETWLTMAEKSGPVLTRRSRETNPFLRVGREQAFRAPIDVEQRLAEMVVGGDGDAGVHATQLSCTASLMSAGVDVDDAVVLVLDATQALAGTADWNWRVEEQTIRAMCGDFLTKLEKQERKPRDIRAALQPLVGVDLARPGSDTTVVSLSHARKLREKPEDQDDEVGGDPREAAKDRARDKISKKQKNEHVVIGKGILEALRDDERHIMYTENQCWMYRGGTWKAMSADEERTWASVMVEHGCNGNRLVSTTKIVNETRAWLQRHPELHKEKVEWDKHGGVATLSGLVNYGTGAVIPYKPEYYVSRRIECEYDPAAECPTWLRMLDEDYGFDAPTISFLQEFTGCALIMRKPRGLRRALVLLGVSNTGKSNIINTIAGLISKEHNPAPLPALEHTHGLMNFLKPHPWVLHEAFEQSRWEMSSTAKALLSGDVVHVNVKNGPLVPVEFRQPIIWGTNVPPQFKEASRAMENRLAIVKMRRAFNPMQTVGTARLAVDAGLNNPAEYVLANEMPGLLNWALAGLRRAMERTHYEFTPDMREALHAMRMDANLASGFMSECCEHDPNSYLLTGDFYGAFSCWWRDHRGGQIPSVDSLGRAMSSLSDPRVVTGERVGMKRIYAGIKMTEEGLDYWNAHSASVAAERSGLRISDRDTEVNRVLGPEQLQRAVFTAMQDAHRSWRPEGHED